jgi:hypothetical protein
MAYQGNKEAGDGHPGFADRVERGQRLEHHNNESVVQHPDANQARRIRQRGEKPSRQKMAGIEKRQIGGKKYCAAYECVEQHMLTGISSNGNISANVSKNKILRFTQDDKPHAACHKCNIRGWKPLLPAESFACHSELFALSF